MLGSVTAAPTAKSVTLTGPVEFQVHDGPAKINNHAIRLRQVPGYNSSALMAVVDNSSKPRVAEFENGIIYQVEKSKKGYARTGATAFLENLTRPPGMQYMDLGFKVYNESTVPEAEGACTTMLFSPSGALAPSPALLPVTMSLTGPSRTTMSRSAPRRTSRDALQLESG
jgi:hypothetical protein